MNIDAGNPKIRPNPSPAADPGTDPKIESEPGKGLYGVFKTRFCIIPPGEHDQIARQIAGNFWIVDGNIAPHHCGFAVRAQKFDNTIDMKSIDCSQSQAVHIALLAPTPNSQVSSQLMLNNGLA